MSSERQEINIISPWWGEHIHRYEEVIKNLLGNEKILDIACGSGFGTNVLSKNTKAEVYGGDLSEEAIELCNSKWRKNNLIFKQMDGTSLPFEDNSFDIIVSFETIEHTKLYKEMLLEFKRVIKPSGTIYISTPNIKINSPTGIVTNPYHTQEWNYKQLKEILNPMFSKTTMYGQSYTRYNKGFTIGKIIEKTLYLKGVRKIPIKAQNSIMKLFIGKQMYPDSSDYLMTCEQKEILKAKTFFCLCKK
jgi:2-polyprenyl-3-methyl-5-hydroxy-6-metoxy-1,4-benzoquinol methylase